MLRPDKDDQLVKLDPIESSPARPRLPVLGKRFRLTPYARHERAQEKARAELKQKQRENRENFKKAREERKRSREEASE